MIRKLCLGVPILFTTSRADADWALNMPTSVMELSAETYELHMLVFWWCVAIAGVVFGVMVWSLVKHRKSKGTEPASFSQSIIAEVIWTIIPIIILLIMVVPSAERLIMLEDSRDPDLTIVVTGYQWKWHYAYPGEDVEFFSSWSPSSADAGRKNSRIDPETVENQLFAVDNPMIVPRGARVRLLLTSNDVVHTWWVPDLAIKKDAVPGSMNEIWFRVPLSGVYRGQCAELCDTDHGFMPTVVKVVEPEKFRAWMEKEDGDMAQLAAAGG